MKFLLFISLLIFSTGLLAQPASNYPNYHNPCLRICYLRPDNLPKELTDRIKNCHCSDNSDVKKMEQNFNEMYSSNQPLKQFVKEYEFFQSQEGFTTIFNNTSIELGHPSICPYGIIFDGKCHTIDFNKSLKVNLDNLFNADIEMGSSAETNE